MLATGDLAPSSSSPCTSFGLNLTLLTNVPIQIIKQAENYPYNKVNHFLQDGVSHSPKE